MTRIKRAGMECQLHPALVSPENMREPESHGDTTAHRDNTSRVSASRLPQIIADYAWLAFAACLVFAAIVLPVVAR